MGQAVRGKVRIVLCDDKLAPLAYMPVIEVALLAEDHAIIQRRITAELNGLFEMGIAFQQVFTTVSASAFLPGLGLIFYFLREFLGAHEPVDIPQIKSGDYLNLSTNETSFQYGIPDFLFDSIQYSRNPRFYLR